MRVERAEQAGQSTTWLQLTLEDGTRLKAPAFSVAELGAFAGKELTDEELARLKAAASKARTKERAVRTVAASAVSERSFKSGCCKGRVTGGRRGNRRMAAGAASSERR